MGLSSPYLFGAASLAPALNPFDIQRSSSIHRLDTCLAKCPYWNFPKPRDPDTDPKYDKDILRKDPDFFGRAIHGLRGQQKSETASFAEAEYGSECQHYVLLPFTCGFPQYDG